MDFGAGPEPLNNFYNNYSTGLSQNVTIKQNINNHNLMGPPIKKEDEHKSATTAATNQDKGKI